MGPSTGGAHGHGPDTNQGILTTNNISKLRKAMFQYSLIRIHMFVVNAKASGLKDDRYSAVIYREDQREYAHARNLTEYLGLKNLSYFQDIDDGIEWLIGRK